MAVHILMIDSANDTCTVALSGDGVLLGAVEHKDQKSQAAAINGMIEQLCKDVAVPLQQIDAFCVCSGPGSYTGLRIGMATAKGFSFALQKPIMAHNRLELIARSTIVQHNQFWKYGIILTARTGEYFMAQYDANAQEESPAQLWQEEDLKNFIQKEQHKANCFFGDAAAQQSLGSSIEAIAPIDWNMWSELVLSTYTRKAFEDTAALEPFYMKEVFIHQAKAKGTGHQ